MLRPHINVTPLRQDSVLSDLETVHNPGKRRKKYVIIIMSHFAWIMGPPNAVATMDIFRRN